MIRRSIGGVRVPGDRDHRFQGIVIAISSDRDHWGTTERRRSRLTVFNPGSLVVSGAAAPPSIYLAQAAF